MRSISFIGYLVVACGQLAMAQPRDTPMDNRLVLWDTTIGRSLLVTGNNTALLTADSIPDVGYATLGGQLLSGGFRRPQEAEAEQAITFDTERYQRIGDWLFHGRFSYRHQRQDNLRWTDIMDPYRGTPFVLADSTVGDWKKHHFALEASASLPLNERLAVGLALNYRVGSGAKNRDPRPLSNVNDITLLPSASWTVNNRHVLGIHGRYRRFKEDIGVLIRAQFAQGLYRLKGLSFHDQILPVSVSYSRAYSGTAWGGGLQHLYHVNPSWQWFNEVEYTRYTEATQDVTIPPLPSGDFRNDHVSLRTTLRYRTGRMEKSLSMAAEAQRGVGHEYHYVSNVLVFDGDMHQQEALSATLTHEWMRHRPGIPYVWSIAPSLNYRQYRASYPTVPTNSRQEFTQLAASLTGGTWVARQVAITAAVHYQTALSDTLDYHADGVGQTVASTVLLPDQDYATADYLSGRLGLKYVFSRPISERDRRQFFAELSGLLHHRLNAVPYAGYGPNRAYASLTIGMYY